MTSKQLVKQTMRKPSDKNTHLWLGIENLSAEISVTFSSVGNSRIITPLIWHIFWRSNPFSNQLYDLIDRSGNYSGGV